MIFKQCLLKLGTTSQVAWIPQAFAALDKYLELRGENGWRVEAVYGSNDGAYLSTGERGYKNEFGSLA